MRIADYVTTLLDDLTEVTPSTDRRGRPNWHMLGASDKCWRCGGQFGDELEPGSHVWHHIIPESEGGPDTPDNKALLCSNCHSVVHRYYLPTGSIGRKRTRDGASRLVGKFKNGTTLSQLLPSPDHRLGYCTKCGACGTVTGVSEGYWKGEGLLVFLDCEECGLKFGEPFIGTHEAPPIDRISGVISALTVDLKSSKSRLPPELESRMAGLIGRLVAILRKLRSELSATNIAAQRSGTDQSVLKKSLTEFYKMEVSKLIPEARALTDECQKHRITEK